MASLLDNMIEDDPIVGKNKLKVNAELWKKRIIEKLVRPAESRETANRLRQKLLLDMSIAETHLDFINSVAGRYDQFNRKFSFQSLQLSVYPDLFQILIMMWHYPFRFNLDPT